MRLLQRTTRTVRPTLDGEAYHQRCLAILNDIEEADGAFSGADADAACCVSKCRARSRVTS